MLIPSIVRGTLGLASALALIYYTHRVRTAYGPVTARLYSILQLTQFHIPYYASRTLPNTFALILSLLAHACFLPSPASSGAAQRRYRQAGIATLTFAAVVFRCELALLLGFQTLYLLLSRHIAISSAITAGFVGGVTGLAATLSVDSYFWLSFSSIPIFTTPLLTPATGLIWPELSAFLFNAVQGQSSAWGASPWHYYFTSALPKLLLNPIWLLTIPLALFTARLNTAVHLVPALLFTASYSLLEHKEWRFIVYIIPQLTLLSSVGASYVWNRRSKGIFYLFPAFAVLSSVPLSAVVSGGMLGVSAANYPGGQAISRLHSHLPSNASMTVHMDVKTCMTGATRFLQEAPLWVSFSSSREARNEQVKWDKTEDPETLLTPSFWTHMDWALVERGDKVIGPYEVVDRVSGFRTVRIYRPGEKVPAYAVSEEVKAARHQGLAEEGTGTGEEMGVVKRALADGFGLRQVFGGWWLGVETEEMITLLRREMV
jgi:hypothetical protein